MAAGGYVTGFTSLRAERQLSRLPVTGTIPSWLSGTLTRNGPALFESGGKGFRHWFDGQAMLHSFTLADGEVAYRNRILETESGCSARDGGRIRFGEFATDPCRSLFARLFTRLDRRPTPNAAVSVVPMNGGLAALTETPLAVEFDRETLETLRVGGYADRIGGAATTAHPHLLRETGDLVNYTLKYGKRSEYRVYRQPAGSMTRELIGSYGTGWPGYVHSFAVTADYAVLVVFPFVVNPLSFLLRSRPFIENFRWRPELGTRFAVMDLRDGTVRTHTTADAIFGFHHINAYQDGADLVVDLCGYPDSAVIDATYLRRLRAPGATIPLARPRRYRLSPDTGEVTGAWLGDVSLELPRINYARCNARPYRYAYGVGAHEERQDDFLNQLVKLDVTTGTARTWYQPGCYPGEPVFVPASDADAEDNGVVLSVVLEAGAARSFLLVLDAATYQELGRAEVPHAIPFGFHGMFSPAHQAE